MGEKGPFLANQKFLNILLVQINALVLQNQAKALP
jgi:hypothetical protein